MPDRPPISSRPTRVTPTCTAPANTGCNACATSISCRRPGRLLSRRRLRSSTAAAVRCAYLRWCLPGAADFSAPPPASTSHRALSAVLFVLRLDCVARGLPLRVCPMPQLVKIAAGRVALPAVKRNGLAGQPLATVGEQKRREILQFLDMADTAHGVAALRPRARLDAGIEPLAGTFGRNFAGRNGVEPDAVAAPLGRQRHGHGVNGRFAHGRRHDVGAAVVDPGTHDGHLSPAMTAPI